MGDLVPRDDGMLDRAMAQVVRAAIEGFGPFKGAPDLVAPLRRRGLTTGAVVDRLVRTQTTHATLQGAVSSVGGIATATVGLVPAAVASMFVQARLCAAIAHAHGHDLDDPRVRADIARLVSGSTVPTGSRKVGVEMAEQAARTVVPQLRSRAAARVATRAAAGRGGGRVAGRLAGISVGRTVPVVGAVVGGAVDLAVTRRIAAQARREFAEPLPVGVPPRSSLP